MAKNLSFGGGSPRELKHFISQKTGLSGKKAKALIDSRRVFVNSRRVWMASHNLEPGDMVTIPDDAAAPSAQQEYKIIYKDRNITAVDKPAGMLSDRDPGSLEDILRKSLSNPKLRAIHRLDRETSGIILYAASTEVFEAYREMWEEKGVRKEYFAVSTGEADFDEKKAVSPVDGKNARSDIKVISRGSGLTLFLVKITTGRKHQIRIHLAGAGYPVAGDTIYGPKNVSGPLQSLSRHMLHAYRLKFKCPVSLKEMDLKAPMHGEMLETAKKAGFR
jgi:RluA family pseudouridine synthase